MAQSTRIETGTRKCLRCDIIKYNTTEFFSRTKSTIGLKYSVDRICKRCRNIEKSARYNKMRRDAHKPVVIICKNRKCGNEVTKVGFKLYCDDECRIEQKRFETNERKRAGAISRDTKEPIPEKFLVRGKISGVDY